MAEEATEEQESGQEEQASTIDRLKGKIKDLTGSSEDEEPQAQEESGGSDSDEAEGEDDADEAGGEGESDEYVGDYKISDADPTEDTSDDDYARAQMRKLEQEDGPPENLEDWPTGKAMYLTFGGAEGDSGYEDGPARQLGPSSTRHLPDGSVEVQGEMAEDPSEYKAEQTVFDEHESMDMDKGAKTEEGGDNEDDSSDSEASSENGAESESSDETTAQSDESSEDSEDGASSVQEEGSEAETAESSS